MSESKPTVIPEWARTTSHITTPSESDKDEGHVYASAPESDIENWRTKLVGQWLKWVNERFKDGTSSSDLIVMHPGTGNTAMDCQETQTGWSLGGNEYMTLAARTLTIKSAVGAGTDNGGRVQLINPDRTTTYRWELYQYQDVCALASYTSAAALELLYWTCQFHGSEPSMTFANPMRLLPATDNNGYLGIGGRQWKEVHAVNLYDANVPFLYARRITSDISVTTSSWTEILPNDNVNSLGLTVEATSQRLETIAGSEGLYMGTYSFIADPSVSGMNFKVSAFRNGSQIAQSEQEFQLIGTEPQLLTFVFYADLDVATDYVQVKAFHAVSSETVAIKTKSILAVQCIRRKKV